MGEKRDRPEHLAPAREGPDEFAASTEGTEQGGGPWVAGGGRVVPMRPRPPTDLGNAERLVDRCANELRYCRQQGLWRYWDGRRWARDWTGEAERRAKATVRSIYSEVRRVTDENERRSLGRWALNSESRRAIQAMVTLAQTEGPLVVAPGDLDRDDWLLATNLGTLDLRTGRLRTSDPADLITHLAPVDYDPSAACPRWETFLARILPDPELRAFLQRSAGYALTASMREQCLWILWGVGGNGKSTFLTTLQALMGDYAMQAPLSMLVDRKRDATPYDLATLPGRRLVAVAETEDVSHLAEGVIKQLTGGEPMRARNLYGDFFEFQPKAKIWLSTNHKPAVKGEDEGIWRRIHLIPFTECISDGELDRDLPWKLRQELPGILAWAVRGCLDWRRHGLQVPRVVIDATLEYRREESVLARFVDDVCVSSPRATVAKKALYEAYTAWCDEQALPPLSHLRLSKALKEQGVGEERGAKGVRSWRGLGLRTYQPGDAGDAGDAIPGNLTLSASSGQFPISASPLSPPSPATAPTSKSEPD